jgi:DNA-binding response OmpR family regulator
MVLNGHILIIDDEAALRQTLSRILQRAGLQVTSAASGQEGLAYLAQQSFDLVYLDIRMPDMNGMEVLKIIHAGQPELPVVLFTAQPDLSSALEALRQGATDYLLKPLQPQDILERTRAILARREMERRRLEIQAQIETLQAELRNLSAETDLPVEKTVSPLSSAERYLNRGKLTLDLHTRRLTIDGREADLPPTAFDYLLVLVRHSPNVVDYQTLVAEGQGYQAELREAQEVVKWHVHHIRQAIESDVRRPRLLINVRGAGYRLVLD